MNHSKYLIKKDTAQFEKMKQDNRLNMKQKQYLLLGNPVQEENERNLIAGYDNEQTKAQLVADALNKKQDIIGKEVGAVKTQHYANVVMQPQTEKIFSTVGNSPMTPPQPEDAQEGIDYIQQRNNFTEITPKEYINTKSSPFIYIGDYKNLTPTQFKNWVETPRIHDVINETDNPLTKMAKGRSNYEKKDFMMTFINSPINIKLIV